MKKTEHYQLNLWDSEDFVLHDDFNADNRKLEAALTAIDAKATLSADAAAAMGLAGGSATASNALDFLSRFNLHWWRRKQKDALIGEAVRGTETDVRLTNSSANWDTVRYSDQIAVSETGAMSLVSPRTLTYQDIENGGGVLGGKYFTIRGDFYQAAEGASFSLEFDSYVDDETGDSVPVFSAAYICACPLTSRVITHTYDWEYLYSIDPDAYPKEAEGDTEYEYLGVPYETFVAPVRLAAGSYVGSGSKAENTVIRFPFAAKLVYVTDAANGWHSGTFVAGGSSATTGWNTSGTPSNIGYTLTGNTLTINAASTPARALNGEDCTYRWVAMG